MGLSVGVFMVLGTVHTLLAEAVGSDEEFQDVILEIAVLDPPPLFLTGAGLAMAVLCGLTFSRLVQGRLDTWKQDRHSMLPLARPTTVMSYSRILYRS